MTGLASFLRHLRQFRRREAGSFSIEAVIVLPLMGWSILSAFSYFDGLKQDNINIKAAHTLSDMLSRETAAIDSTYVNGMQTVLTFLTSGRYDTALRVSVFRFDQAGSEFVLEWSQASNNTPALTPSTQGLIEARLPLTADGDTLITVETWIDYKALYTYALEDTVLYQFTATRPRYVPQLHYVFDDGSTTADQGYTSGSNTGTGDGGGSGS